MFTKESRRQNCLRQQKITKRKRILKNRRDVVYCPPQEEKTVTNRKEPSIVLGPIVFRGASLDFGSKKKKPQKHKKRKTMKEIQWRRRKNQKKRQKRLKAWRDQGEASCMSKQELKVRPQLPHILTKNVGQMTAPMQSQFAMDGGPNLIKVKPVEEKDDCNESRARSRERRSGENSWNARKMIGRDRKRSPSRSRRKEKGGLVVEPKRNVDNRDEDVVPAKRVPPPQPALRQQPPHVAQINNGWGIFIKLKGGSGRSSTGTKIGMDDNSLDETVVNLLKIIKNTDSSLDQKAISQIVSIEKAVRKLKDDRLTSTLFYFLGYKAKNDVNTILRFLEKDTTTGFIDIMTTKVSKLFGGTDQIIPLDIEIEESKKEQIADVKRFFNRTVSQLKTELTSLSEEFSILVYYFPKSDASQPKVTVLTNLAVDTRDNIVNRITQYSLDNTTVPENSEETPQFTKFRCFDQNCSKVLEEGDKNTWRFFAIKKHGKEPLLLREKLSYYSTQGAAKLLEVIGNKSKQEKDSMKRKLSGEDQVDEPQIKKQKKGDIEINSENKNYTEDNTIEIKSEKKKDIEGNTIQIKSENNKDTEGTTSPYLNYLSSIRNDKKIILIQRKGTDKEKTFVLNKFNEKTCLAKESEFIHIEAREMCGSLYLKSHCMFCRISSLVQGSNCPHRLLLEDLLLADSSSKSFLKEKVVVDCNDIVEICESRNGEKAYSVKIEDTFETVYVSKKDIVRCSSFNCKSTAKIRRCKFCVLICSKLNIIYNEEIKEDKESFPNYTEGEEYSRSQYVNYNVADQKWEFIKTTRWNSTTKPKQSSQQLNDFLCKARAKADEKGLVEESIQNETYFGYEGPKIKLHGRNHCENEDCPGVRFKKTKSRIISPCGVFICDLCYEECLCPKAQIISISPEEPFDNVIFGSLYLGIDVAFLEMYDKLVRNSSTTFKNFSDVLTNLLQATSGGNVRGLSVPVFERLYFLYLVLLDEDYKASVRCFGAECVTPEFIASDGTNSGISLNNTIKMKEIWEPETEEVIPRHHDAKSRSLFVDEKRASTKNNFNLLKDFINSDSKIQENDYLKLLIESLESESCGHSGLKKMIHEKHTAELKRFFGILQDSKDEFRDNAKTFLKYFENSDSLQVFFGPYFLSREILDLRENSEIGHHVKLLRLPLFELFSNASSEQKSIIVDLLSSLFSLRNSCHLADNKFPACEPKPYNPMEGVAYHFTEHCGAVREMPRFEADKQDTNEESSCNKFYIKLKGNAQLYVVMCPLHVTILGFHLIGTGAEGRRDPFSVVFRYMEKPPKYCFHDNACQCAEYCLNRAPDVFKETNFFLDLFHGKSHLCSPLYKPEETAPFLMEHFGLDTSSVEECNLYLTNLRRGARKMLIVHFMLFALHHMKAWNDATKKRFEHRISLLKKI